MRWLAPVVVLFVAEPMPADEVVVGGWVEDMRDGSPIAGAEVIVYWSTPDGEMWEQAVDDDDGSFVFRGLRPKAYLLEVRIGDQFQFFRGTCTRGEKVALTLRIDRSKLKTRLSGTFRGMAVDSVKIGVRRIPRYSFAAPPATDAQQQQQPSREQTRR